MTLDTTGDGLAAQSANAPSQPADEVAAPVTIEVDVELARQTIVSWELDGSDAAELLVAERTSSDDSRELIGVDVADGSVTATTDELSRWRLLR